MYFITNENNECTGCGACEAICPKGAISMLPDPITGHIYPHIINDKCVKCKLCEKVCPLEQTELYDSRNIQSYVTMGSAEDVERSASGGAFYSIASYFIANGGVVYGAKFNNDLKVVHDRATTISDVQELRKSKYIQSNIKGCLNRVYEDLKQGNKVLFTGVPCQCAGLNNYLKHKRVNVSNLVTISLLCHGVPSQYLFDEYIKQLEQEKKKKVLKYEFKNKIPYKGVVNSRTACITFSDGETLIVGTDVDPFLRLYYRRMGYRPSCASCHFACENRTSDITLGDAWKVEQIMPDLNPLQGVSLVLANTDKGKNIVKMIKFEHCRVVDTNWAINSQRLFHHPTMVFEKNDKFFEILGERGFRKSVMALTRPGLIGIIKSVAKTILKHIGVLK